MQLTVLRGVEVEMRLGVMGLMMACSRGGTTNLPPDVPGDFAKRLIPLPDHPCWALGRSLPQMIGLQESYPGEGAKN